MPATDRQPTALSIGHAVALALGLLLAGCPTPRAPRPLPPPPPPPTDIDSDRVFDHEDRCPDEPEDRDGHADDDGCPDPDNDGDGLEDGVDVCPDNPGVLIAAGCPPSDRDGDTVLDHHDACPINGGPIAQYGCPEPNTMRIDLERIELGQKIYFAVDKGIIRSQSFAALDALAVLLRQHPQVLVEVRNHRDDTGRERYGMKITQRRADSVRDYLVHKGVPPEQLEARGYGSDMPIATNKTPEGRAQNRRTEFVIRQHRVGPGGRLALELRDLEASPAIGPGNRDGDGFADGHDRCPETPGPVEHGGCPAP